MTTACVIPGICVPTQMSQPSFVRCTVQFIGSIVGVRKEGLLVDRLHLTG